MVDAKPRGALRRRPEQARSRARVQAILEAAQGLIAERGIDPVRMSDVAKAADMSVTALYRYFPHKAALVRELTLELYDRTHGWLTGFVESSLQTSEDAALGELILRGAREYLRVELEEPYRSGLRAATFADEALRRLDVEDTQRTARLVAGALAELSGTAPTLGLERTVFLFVTGLDAVVRVASLHEEPARTALVEDYVRLMLPGLEAALAEATRD